jgi:hypothetical protein
MKSLLQTTVCALATCVALSAALAVLRVALAAEPTVSGGASTSSLDDQLLRGSDANSQKAPPDAAPAIGEPIRQPRRKGISREFAPLDEALQKALTGDNAGKTNAKNLLADIIVQMRDVQQRLASSKADKLTQRQEQRISDELKFLVDQLAKSQSQAGQSDNPREANSQQANRGTPKPGSRQGGKTPAGNLGSLPARNSTPKLRETRSQSPGASVEYELTVKELDRLHLPQRDREAMLDSPADEFLPGHEESIQEYFKRLVEEDEK